MTDFELIEKSIKRISRLKSFFAETVSKNYPIVNLRRAIKILMKKGKVVSISKGIYVRPKSNRYMKKGEYLIRPQPEDVVRLIAKKTGEVIIHNESVALNYVGLSTQIPVSARYYTSGRSRVIKIKRGGDIELEHISPNRIVMPGTITCLIVTALWEWNYKPIHPLSIKKIHERLTPEEYSEVIENLNKMPVWIKEAFIRYQNMDPRDPLLVDYEYY